MSRIPGAPTAEDTRNLETGVCLNVRKLIRDKHHIHLHQWSNHQILEHIEKIAESPDGPAQV